MHILITGATGLVGRTLVPKLLSLSHQVTVVTRDPERAQHIFSEQVTYLSSLTTLGSLDDFNAVINFAGEPIIGKRWNKAQKHRLCQSRWQITQQLSTLFRNSKMPPDVFISGSAMGFYGDQGQREVTEETIPQKEFTHYLCERWESHAMAAQSERTRVCLCRTGIILSPDGGALSKMLPAFRFGLGGKMGNGQQYLPWIHIDDMVSAIVFLLEKPQLSGAFNISSPNPSTNKEFSLTLGKVLHRPTFIPLPAPVLKLMLGEASALLLGGQKGVPAHLQESGFHFRFAELKGALEDLLHKK